MLLLAALVLLAGPQAMERSAGADEFDTVDQFLARLGLVDLQILHLEEALQEQRPAGEQLKLARRLADLYASRLMSSSEDQQAYQQLLSRIETLVEKFPEANTPALRVSVLQADFNRAEGHLARWMNDRTETDQRDAGRPILARIAPQLNRYRQQLDAEADSLLKELEQVDNPDVLKAKENQLQQVSSVATQAAYLAAWSNYYTGLVEPGTDGGKAQFLKARDGFRKILGIEEADYAKVDPDLLALDSTWRCRALMGLGQAEAAAGNLDGCAACFKLLEGPRVPPLIRDEAPYRHVQALLLAGQVEAAYQVARQRIAGFSGEATPGMVGLCAAMVQAGFGPERPPSPEEAREIGMLGISGLARLRQFRTVHKLLEKYEIGLDEASGFLLPWLRGQQLFAVAEKSKKTEDYEAAAEALSAALAAPEAAKELAGAGRCRYTLAWCYYRMKDYAKAARQFEDAVTGLKAAGAKDAADSAWMAFASYYRMAADSPRYTTAAIEVLESIKRDFPTSPYARKADFQIAKLQQNAVLPAEAIRTLSQIQPGRPNYLPARYDLCLLFYRQWAAQRAKNKDAATQARQLRDAVDLYLRAAKNDPDTARKLRSLMLVVAAAVEGSKPDRETAGQYLAQAAPLADSLPASSSQAAEYHYRAMRYAQQADDSSVAQRHADWLVQHAAGSIYEMSALIASAKAAEAAVDSAAPGQKRPAGQHALEVYRRLAAVLGDSPDVIRSKKNALVAQSKLATYAEQTGDHGEAAAALEKILAAYPNDRDALRRAGLAQFQAGRYEVALAHWRLLQAALPDGTDPWYEAKYHHIACLARTDKEMARKVLAQFKLLDPKMGGPSWGSKFESLQRELKLK